MSIVHFTNFLLPDINECDSNPCQNSGVCSDLMNAYNCDCTDTGFTGINCQRRK